MQRDIRERRKIKKFLCNPEKKSEKVIAGVSPKSSGDKEKGVKGGSVNKPLGTSVIPKKGLITKSKVRKTSAQGAPSPGTKVSKEKSSKAKVAKDGSNASRSKNGRKEDDKPKGTDEGPVPTVQKSLKQPKQKGEGDQLAESTRESHAKASKGDEKACEPAQNPENKDDEKACEPDRIPEVPEAPKGKRKLKIFVNPKEEEEYKAKRKLKSKAKKTNLKEKRRQSVDGAKTPSGSPMQPTPTKTTKAVSSSQSKVKQPKSTTSAKKTKGAPSQGAQGATSQGSKVLKHTMESLLPEPKKLKGHVTTREEDIEMLSRWLEHDVTAPIVEAPQAHADLLSRHRSISVQQLAQQTVVALTQEGGEEVRWVDSSYQPTSAYVFAEGRLREAILQKIPEF